MLSHFKVSQIKDVTMEEDEAISIGEMIECPRYSAALSISGLVSHLVQKHKNNCSRCSQMLGRGGRRSGGYAN